MFETEEVYSGLRAQDLQEAKDQGSFYQKFSAFSKFAEHNLLLGPLVTCNLYLQVNEIVSQN